MLKPLVALFAAFFFFCGATLVGATVNPDPDEIGVYFDLSADTVCITGGPTSVVIAYIIITNPSASEVWGIEFSLCTSVAGGDENLFQLVNESWYSSFISLPVETDWCLEGRRIWFNDPVPQVEENVVLVQLLYMRLDDIGVEFYIRPHPVETIENGLPAYMDAAGAYIPLGVSSGDPSLPVAAVAGECNVVSVETKTFSGLKCLYR